MEIFQGKVIKQHGIANILSTNLGDSQEVGAFSMSLPCPSGWQIHNHQSAVSLIVVVFGYWQAFLEEEHTCPGKQLDYNLNDHI